jgi:hypothetical protein
MRTSDVAVERQEAVKASQPRNIADIVSAVFSQSAEDRQRFHWQNSSCDMIALRSERVRQNILRGFVDLGIVCGWDYDLPGLAVPCEENPNLRLWYRYHEEGLRVRQDLGRVEGEVRKTLLIELLI